MGSEKRGVHTPFCLPFPLSCHTFLGIGVGGGGTRGHEAGRKGAGSVQEKRGREVRFPRWQEIGELGKNCTTVNNILQLKKCKEMRANNNNKKNGWEAGLKGHNKWKV